MSTVIYRVQDRDGRGPYRPGFSLKWVDLDRPPQPLVFQEFGLDFAAGIKPGQSAGCAFRDLAGIRQWFSQGELTKLYKFGYAVVAMEADEILHESPHQLVFGRNQPLKKQILKTYTLKELLPWP